MTPLDISVPFLLGLVSSLHCTQMCGPLVLAYSLHARGPLAHFAYNAGRIATYSFLGAVAGAAGSGVSTVAHMAGIEQGAAIVAGIATIVSGLLMWGGLSARWPVFNRLNPDLIRIRSARPSWWSRWSAILLKSPHPQSKLLLGLLLGFMPCGLVYAALLKAVDTGGATAGALTMLAFGLGTSGALLAIGLFSSAITARFGRYSNAFATVSVMLLGVFLLARGLGFNPGMGHHHHAV